MKAGLEGEALLEVVRSVEADNKQERTASAERQARYRARGGGKIPDDLRRSVYERDGYACVYCGISENLCCDHDVPVSRGGDTSLENLVTACIPCNSRKKDRDRKAYARAMQKDVRGNGADASAEIPGNVLGQIAENGRTHSRVEDNILNLPLVDTSRKNLLPPPPLPSKPEPDGFAEFWEVYPKRDGSSDRKGAVKAFGPALKRASLETILDGAQHFADAMQARGKTGTEFIPQARTWLNGDRWNERYDAATAADSKEAQWRATLEKYAAPSRA